MNRVRPTYAIYMAAEQRFEWDDGDDDEKTESWKLFELLKAYSRRR